jgi:hypothetical protein
MHAHNDRFISPLYNPFFGEERVLYNQNTGEVIPLVNRIADNGSAKGIKWGVSKNFWEDSSVEFSYFQNFFGYLSGHMASAEEDAIVRLKVVLSNEKIKWLRGAEFSFEEFHSGYWGANLFAMTPQSRLNAKGNFIVYKSWEPYFNFQYYFLRLRGTTEPSDLGGCTDVCMGINKHF